jgi:hypothetical protein
MPQNKINESTSLAKANPAVAPRAGKSMVKTSRFAGAVAAPVRKRDKPHNRRFSSGFAGNFGSLLHGAT